MEVNPDYLDHFATNIGAEPEEIPLSGIEMNGNNAIGVDDPDGSTLSVVYKDDYENAWSAQEGTAKRATFVRVLQEGKPIGGVLYKFQGLKRLADLRQWYRDKIGIVDPPAPESE